MKQKQQFLLEITLPEGSVAGNVTLPADKDTDASQWLNQLKTDFPGLISTVAAFEAGPEAVHLNSKKLPSKARQATKRLSDLDNGTGSTDIEQLTSRQRDIVNLLFKGYSYREIGKSLGISVPTVRAHLHSAYKRLQVKSRAQAVAKLFRS
jgi:RNA polymerase sigma factor (sigma-70 family)